MEEMTKNNPKILGLVTLYNPDIPDATNNIMRYLPYLDLLIIWDNSPLEANLKQKVLESLTQEADKIIWHGDGKNYCIAPAINYAWHYAQENDFDLILLMDQDSQWEDFHSYITEVAERFQISQGNVFCPYIPSDDTFVISEEAQEKSTFINSGTVIPTSILNRIGGADEAFPLDALDHDLAIRIQKAGYKIVSLTKHILHHSVGNIQMMGPFHIYTHNYSPQRLYSISRSHIIKYRKHKDWFTSSEIKVTFKELYFKPFLRILLAEPQKAYRLKMFFKGIYDGITFPINKKK
jgi:rhamnosyltransferase